MLYTPTSIYCYIPLYTAPYCFILLHTAYTGWNRGNVPNFGRVFLMLNYTEKTQNTYIQS